VLTEICVMNCGNHTHSRILLSLCVRWQRSWMRVWTLCQWRWSTRPNNLPSSSPRRSYRSTSVGSSPVHGWKVDLSTGGMLPLSCAMFGLSLTCCELVLTGSLENKWNGYLNVPVYPLEDWKRPLACPRITSMKMLVDRLCWCAIKKLLTHARRPSHSLSLIEAANVAQNLTLWRPLWLLRHHWRRQLWDTCARPPPLPPPQELAHVHQFDSFCLSVLQLAPVDW